MKALFSRSGGAGGPRSSNAPSSSPASSGPLGRFNVPPFPHPLPHRLLAIHICPSGLVIVPVTNNHQHHHHHHHHHHQNHASSAAAADAASHASGSASQAVQAGRNRAGSISAARTTNQGDVEDVAHEAAKLHHRPDARGGGVGAHPPAAATDAHAAARRPPFPTTTNATSESGARVRWGVRGSVEALSAADVRAELANAASAATPTTSAKPGGAEPLLAFGVLGLLRVFKDAYLFVVTSRQHAGDFLHPSLPVYRCSGVLAIPLDADKARATFSQELLRQSYVPPPKEAADDDDDDDDESSGSDTDGEGRDEADGYESDVVTPSIVSRDEFFQLDAANANANNANLSKPTSQAAEQGRMDAVGAGSATLRPAKAGAWYNRKKRLAASEVGMSALAEEGGGAGPTHLSAAADDGVADGVDIPAAAADAAAATGSAPSAVVEANRGLEGVSGAGSAAEMMTSDQRWHEANKAELEEKTVKETARQYAKGSMWFSYDFDLTTNLQRKQQLCDEAAGGASSTKTGAVARDLLAAVMPTGGAAANRAQGTGGGASPPARGLPFEEPRRSMPLWRRVDRRFWHNEHLAKDFVDAGLHSLILPVMQGYFQVTALPIDTSPPSPPITQDLAGDAMDAVSAAASSERVEALLLLVSRRSKERAGLRYQRRGVDDDGHVANFVETEQVLLVRRAGQAHVLAFVQWRGSIPLFWRQDPFNLKPPPILERGRDENWRACSCHFEAQVARYGKVTCVNLAEQSGKEGAITDAYRRAVEQGVARPDEVRYHAFDFHHVCAGMKFERVSLLVDDMAQTLSEMGCFWRAMPNGAGRGGEAVLSRQSGAFRVSCLDCLDRTNVVQSAFARHMIDVQLERLGIHMVGTRSGNSSSGAMPNVTTAAPSSTATPEGAATAARLPRDEAFDFVFNDSWANNGDAISATYAGTNALKGDYTRTGQRNFRGMMNDATNSVWRTVQGAVTDFFKQTVMDFQHGHLSVKGLERYLDELNTKDPAEGSRLRRARANAIESCASLVLGADEERLAGWTLFAPLEANRVHSAKLEEKVVILSNKAIYICGHDFQSEKLVEFSRILLGDITGMTKGLYLLSPKEGYHPENHWGFTLSYLKDEKRLNTASIRNVPPPQAEQLKAGAAASAAATGAMGSHFFAFRVVVDEFAGTLERELPSNGSGGGGGGEKASAGGGGVGPGGGRGFFGTRLGTRTNSSERTAKGGGDSPTAAAATPSSRSSSPSKRNPAAAASEAAPAAKVVKTFDVPPQSPGELSSRDIVERIVDMVTEGCLAAGALSADQRGEFVRSETIQSLAQARANASLFAPLIEGLKRRVWL